MAQPPPPPPPHGDNPRSSTNGSGLPPGKYDIFIIPEHSAGSGFLYLPSLQPNINSFVAGFASALGLVVIFQSMAPAFRAWWTNFQSIGNMGMLMLTIAVGLGAWSLGRQQQENAGGPGRPGAGGSGSGGDFGGSTPNAGPTPQSPPNHQSPPPPKPETPRGAGPGASWQQPRGTPQPGNTRAETPKNAWEKAREETRRREEERKAKEEEQKRKEEAARRLRELREREAKEREQREQREKEAKERLAREKAEREAKEKAEREAKERLAEEQRRRDDARKGSTYAFSGVGEKLDPWPNGRPLPPSSQKPATSPRPARAAPPPSSASASASALSSPNPSTPTKKPAASAAKPDLGPDADAYSFRPYDKPKQHLPRKKSVSDFSDASWTPSQSTARTTPPPSVRAPYSTKDPDKIVIRAVYSFLNQFTKTPASQLIAGVGSVTDGLILRITTEGLFIDDDRRGEAQREWDVKAWTLKSVEVWCPQHFANSAAGGVSGSNATSGSGERPSLFKAMPGGLRGSSRAAERGGAAKTLTGDEADAHLTELLRACKDNCRLGLLSAASCSSSSSSYYSSARSAASGAGNRNPNDSNNHDKTGEWKLKGLHLLRATIRDQDGKRYMFVLSEEESWKVALGLQRLRRGTQVRALGVAGMSAIEAKNTLGMLGWGQ